MQLRKVPQVRELQQLPEPMSTVLLQHESVLLVHRTLDLGWDEKFRKPGKCAGGHVFGANDEHGARTRTPDVVERANPILVPGFLRGLQTCQRRIRAHPLVQQRDAGRPFVGSPPRPVDQAVVAPGRLHRASKRSGECLRIHRKIKPTNPLDLLQTETTLQQKLRLRSVTRHRTETGRRRQCRAAIGRRVDDIGLLHGPPIGLAHCLEPFEQRRTDADPPKSGQHLDGEPYIPRPLLNRSLVDRARHDSPINSGGQANLRFIRVLPVRQQLGRFVGEVSVAKRVGLDRVANVRHLDEVGGIRRLNRRRNDNLVNRESGHRSNPLATVTETCKADQTTTVSAD